MKLLLELMDTQGVSGNEEAVRALILREIKNHVDEIKFGKLGSLIAIKKGKAPRVMLAAHLDEVGLMVKGIEKNGNICLSEIGGIITKSLIGQKVHVDTINGSVDGVIKKKNKKSKNTEIDNLIFKTKFSKKELTKKGIEIGNYISFEVKSKIIKGKFIEGRALDDRIGCYILIELAKKLKKSKNEICFAFTTQEEMGLYGAKTTAFQMNPDWAIAVDVSDSDDLFQKDSLGKGPVITIKDEDFIANRCINGWLKEIAKSKNISTIYDVSDEGTTDATNISLSRGGVPSTVVGVAVKNMHKPVGIANIKDIENTIELLYELMIKPPKVCLV